LSLDVDNNGGIEPFDALLVINELNNPRFANGNALPRPVNTALTTFPFFDSNGNNTVDPQDALLIINRLNGIGSSGELGEGEFSGAGQAESGLAQGWAVTPSASTETLSVRLRPEFAAEKAVTIESASAASRLRDVIPVEEEAAQNLSKRCQKSGDEVAVDDALTSLMDSSGLFDSDNLVGSDYLVASDRLGS
ncbi:MAG: dockerin type I domain-containing protein, partial [Planctomycetota bacterium]